MKKMQYRGSKLNLRGRYIKGIYHYRNIFTWEYAEELRPARNW